MPTCLDVFETMPSGAVMPIGLTKGKLKIMDCKAPRRTVATKKVGKQTQLAQRVASHTWKR
jgi:hypothetical protein